MSTVAENQPYPPMAAPEQGDSILSNRFFFLWPLAVCIPVVGTPRVTLFDVICVLIFAMRPWRTFTNTTITGHLRIAVICLNVAYPLSAIINHASIFQTVWHLGAADLVIIDALVLCSVLADASIAQINQFFFYFCVGVCAQIIYPEDTATFIWPIKFLLNTPLGVILIMLCYAIPLAPRTQRGLTAGVLLLYATIAVLVRARNAAAIELVAVIVYFLPQIQTLQRFSLRTYLLSIAGAIAGLYAIAAGYYYLAVHGFLGQIAKGIATYQASFFGGGIGVLLGGRPEVLALGLGIIASPLLGHGAGNDLKTYADMLVVAGFWRPEYLQTVDKTILHSVLFGAGFEAGIFAMIFWLYVCHLCMRAIIHAIAFRPTAYEIGLILCLQAFWNILFSPLIGVTRLSLVPAFVYGLYAIRKNHKALQA